MTGPRSAGSLAGIRVIEVANFIAGPLAARLLGDLGADVVKVESPPDKGDPFRAWANGLYSPHFQAYNRNKRSIAVDLRAPEGRALVRTLAKDADVVVSNLRRSVSAELGLTYADLAPLNPKVVVCSISAFGSTGPLSERPGFDTMGQALGGLLGLFVDPEDPRPFGPEISDQLAGMFAAYGILAALLQRSVTGLGQDVETSLLASTVSFVGQPLVSSYATGTTPDRFTRVRGSQAFVFRCADAKLVAIHLSSPEKFWLATVRALGAERLLADERFATRARRVEHYDALYEELAPPFATHDRSWWLERLQRFEVPASPVNTLEEVMTDPQVRSLGMLEVRPDAAGARGLRVGSPLVGPVRTDEAPPPLLGQHTLEVLQELGMDTGSIARLRADGVVVEAPHLAR